MSVERGELPLSTPGHAVPSWGARRFDAEDQELTLGVILGSVLRHRRAIVGASLVGAVLTGLAVILMPPVYSTTASFMPTGSTSSSALSGLAAQFGVNVPTAEFTLPSKFYSDLLKSGWFLQRVATASYSVRTDDGTRAGTFIEIAEIEEDSPAEELDKAVRMLANDVISVTTSNETGVVSARIGTEFPQLSNQIGTRVLTELDEFSSNLRRRHAEAETQFMAARVDSAEGELRLAENTLQAFVQHNRDFVQDPLLQLEHDRLQRQVIMRQEVYTTVASAHEQARLSAVRNTPSISVVEPAALPLTPDEKQLVLKVILAALAFGAIVAVFFVWADFRSRVGMLQSENDQLRDLWRETRGDMLRLLRVGRR